MDSLKVDVMLINDYLPNFPVQATEYSAGYDLKAYLPDGSLIIGPNECYIVSSGVVINMLSIDIPCVGLLMPRSGAGSKGLVLGNLTGVIDQDYHGEIKMALWNRTSEPKTIFNGDKVAQLLIVPILKPTLVKVDSFKTTSVRGDKGFGSSGR